MNESKSAPTSPRLAQLFDLSGQVALITGGSGELGMQIAEALGEYGARILLAARKPDRLDSAVARLRAQAIDASAIACDLSQSGAAEVLVEEIARQHGRLDILVNNAGATWGAPMADYPLEGWNKVLDLNVTAMFLLAQAAGRQCFLPQGHGKILNVASIAGLRGHHPQMVGTIAYNTAKGAVINFTRALAAEWGPHNVNVNALAPGFFPSKMTAATLDLHGEDLIDRTPLGRLGGPADLKGAALLLASAAGRHISGQILAVDGGMTAI